MKIKIKCLPPVQVIVQIAGMHWYNGKNGYVAENCPVLAIVYKSGHVQLMRDQHDESKFRVRDLHGGRNPLVLI